MMIMVIIAQLLIPPYVRSQYGGWVDADHDCHDTRAEVLLHESVGPVTMDGCRVVAGTWIDPYTGETITQARLIDIDHTIPLREAHVSGGWQWDRREKRAFANDLHDVDHLVATHRTQNRRKGARDPAEWMPPTNQCWYALTWISIKARWRLTFDAAEVAALVDTLKEC